MSHKKKIHVYIIGIGGKGLNSIAEFCLQKGYKVSGSDMKESRETQNLSQKGAQIYYLQTGDHVTKEIDMVVYSSVISEFHPERLKAKEFGIPTTERAEFLAQITDEYERISVAGSHGKSTTSALATLALRSVYKRDINAITGAYIKELNSYQSAGESKECVLEACEYANSFLHIPGDYTLITALEKSHMEFFKNEDMMNLAFAQFVNNHKESATLIINGDNQILKEMCINRSRRVQTCGFGAHNKYVIGNAKLKADSSTFSIYKERKILYENIKIKIPGLYNILNVALVFALLDQKSLDATGFKKLLLNFTGVGRRFEIVRHKNTTYVDDFAHHPTQVKNLISGLKQFFPQQKIYAVFEPRQYHLIKTFLKEYGKSFAEADEVYVTDIVSALGDKEEDIQSLSTEDVLTTIKKYSNPKNICHIKSYQEIVDRLKGVDLSGAVVATIGAGSVFQVRDLLVNRVQ